MIAFLLACSLIMPPATPPPADTPIPRGWKAVAQFRKSYGLVLVGKGQIKHCTPLTCGGPDTLDNLQFLCGPELPLKEKLERLCTVQFDCKSREENMATMKKCPGTVLKK